MICESLKELGAGACLDSSIGKSWQNQIDTVLMNSKADVVMKILEFEELRGETDAISVINSVFS